MVSSPNLLASSLAYFFMLCHQRALEMISYHLLYKKPLHLAPYTSLLASFLE